MRVTRLCESRAPSSVKPMPVCLNMVVNVLVMKEAMAETTAATRNVVFLHSTSMPTMSNNLFETKRNSVMHTLLALQAPKSHFTDLN